MSGELDDTQFASLWLPCGLGNRRVGTDLETEASDMGCVEADATGEDSSGELSSLAEELLSTPGGSDLVVSG